MSQHRDAPARPLYDHVEGIRIRRGWTKTQLARAAKTDRGTIDKWAHQPRSPLPQTVKGVAEALGIDQEEALRLAGILPAEVDEAEESTVAVLRAEIAELRRLNAEQAKRNDEHSRVEAELRRRIEELAASQNVAKPADDTSEARFGQQSGRPAV